MNLPLFLFQSSESNYVPTIIFSGLLSVVAGSLITRFGVWLKNEANAKRQKETLSARETQQRTMASEMLLTSNEIFFLGFYDDGC